MGSTPAENTKQSLGKLRYRSPRATSKSLGFGRSSSPHSPDVAANLGAVEPIPFTLSPPTKTALVIIMFFEAEETPSFFLVGFAYVHLETPEHVSWHNAEQPLFENSYAKHGSGSPIGWFVSSQERPLYPSHQLGCSQKPRSAETLHPVEGSRWWRIRNSACLSCP